MKVAKSTNKTVKTSHESEEKILGEVQIKLMIDGQLEMIPGLTQSNMNDFTWGELANLIKHGHADYFDPGDTKDITLDLDTSYFDYAVHGTYKVVVMSNSHNETYEGSNRVHFCIGRDINDVDITFWARRMNAANDNTGGWASSELRQFLNNEFFAALPEDLSSVITPCTKYTDNVGGSDMEAPEKISATQDKIWLPSEYEVLGKNQFANNYEVNYQQQYAIFNDNTHRAYRYRHHEVSTLSSYWFRGPLKRKIEAFCAHSSTDQYVNDYHNATLKFGVLPCFTIS